MSDTTNPPILASAKDIDLRAKRVDLDRWLASRYAPVHERRALCALYLVNHELVRATRASEVVLAHIRLQWWREAMVEIFSGETVRRHDIVLAAASTWTARQGAREGLQAAIDRLIDRFQDVVDGAGDAGACRASGELAVAAGEILGCAEADAPNLRLAGDAYMAGLLRTPGAEDKIAALQGVAVDGQLMPAVAYAMLGASYAAAEAPGGWSKRGTIFMTILKGQFV